MSTTKEGRRKAIYPGTFDPVTKGHVDIAMRACRLFDEVIFAVARGFKKKTLFSDVERVSMVRHEIETLTHGGMIDEGRCVTVVSFDGLLVDFAKQQGTHTIVRGLRAISDFEYELTMASANARLNSHIDTLFLMACEEQHFTSSRLVREIAALQGDVLPFVSSHVAMCLQKKMAAESP
ncbi:MAG: pantetheine-phosphate adenylyltransferase [Alphaproteobacteria bacterium GM7ARS4]|nr:pantetheine-phosphate adenylyltransferase [Alphaproteobacteria bacterium GM7ARS4]